MKSTRDVIIQAQSLQSAKSFYHDVLGFEVIEESERLVGFETGSFVLYVELGAKPGSVFEFNVPDLTPAKNRLIKHGCRVVDDNPAIPRLYLRDPFGLLFNLNQSKD